MARDKELAKISVKVMTGVKGVRQHNYPEKQLSAVIVAAVPGARYQFGDAKP
jgi:hypothetical protein